MEVLHGSSIVICHVNRSLQPPTEDGGDLMVGEAGLLVLSPVAHGMMRGLETCRWVAKYLSAN